MKTVLANLINKKFYKTKETALVKITTVYAVNVITDDDYSELVALIETVYGETVEAAV